MTYKAAIAKSANFKASFWDLTYKFITWAITAISNATTDDFKAVIGWVLQAEKDLPDGASRATWVRKMVDQYIPALVPLFKDLLISLAVSYLGYKGTIHLKANS